MGGVYKSIYKGMLFDRVIQIVAVLLQGAVSPILMGASSIFGAASDLSIRSEKQELIPDRERATVNSIISSSGFKNCLGWGKKLNKADLAVNFEAKSIFF